MIRHHRDVRGPLLAVALSIGAAHAAAAEPPGRPPEGDPLTRTARAAATLAYRQLASTPDKVDEERLKMLRELSRERAVKRPDLAVRALQPLGRRETIMAALNRNLDLAIARRDPERARATLAEAEAVFDPVFDLQVQYARLDTYRRTRFGTVRPQTFVPQGNETVFFDVNEPFENRYCTLFCRMNIVKNLAFDFTFNEATVVAFEFYENLDTTPVGENVDTSPGRSFGHPTEKTTFTMAVTQNLPWGGTLTLTDQTIHQYVYYRRGFEWPGGQWTTNITGSLDTPLPYTKGFGVSGANAIAEKKARIGAERADLVFDQTIQGVLRDTEAAYFNLVRAGESLSSAVKVEGMVKALRDRMARLYADQLGTRYQMAQLEAEVSKAGLNIESALEGYITASIQLGVLVGDVESAKGRVLYVPIAFRADMEKAMLVPTLKAAIAEAKRSRPDLLIAELDERTSELSAAQALNETKPDMRLGVNVNSGQAGDVYGYRNPVDSHSNLLNGDTLSQSFGLTFTRPWDNRAANARLGQARLGLESQALGTRASQAAVRRELTQSLTNLQTARGNEKSRSKEAQSLLDAYESYERSLDVGLASEDEIINTLRRYLNAEVARVSAMASRRAAENDLLYAQGLITSVLPAEVAVSRADRERMKTLARDGRLHRFAKPPEVRDANTRATPAGEPSTATGDASPDTLPRR